MVFFFFSFETDTKPHLIFFKDVWPMHEWPVITSEAENERNHLITTHRPVPLPAYDINNQLIPPFQCKAKLAGAIVRTTFTASHLLVHPSKENPNPSNTFAADIHSIQVLVNPPSQTILPKKRKTPLAFQEPPQKR